jgi:ABC-type antimicrobial peptide transport system permease subunit
MEFARRATRERLPKVDVLRVENMSQVLEPELRPWRLGASLFSVLGVLAAVVAAIGVYSVISYGVSQRTHEMGVRIALGARLADILGLVAGEGLRVVVVGIAIGVGSAVAMGRLVSSLLYGVSTRDPLVLAGVCVLLTVMGLSASLIPAVRAARIDPVRALRAD